MSKLDVENAAMPLSGEAMSDEVSKDAVESLDRVDEATPTMVSTIDDRSTHFSAGERLSTSSSSSDEVASVSRFESELASVKDEEESEKLTTDSGYESDRRKSFSFSSIGEGVVDGEAVKRVDGLEPAKTPRSDEDEAHKSPSKAGECPPPQPLLPLWSCAKAILPLRCWQQQIALQHQAFLAQGRHPRPLVPTPAMQLKQVEAAVMEKPHSGAWEHYLKFVSAQAQIQSKLANPVRPMQLPPVVLPLPVCCKASPVGLKEARKYAIPKYAVGFVIGHNGTRIQATRDVSGATIVLLGDQVDHHSVVGVYGTQGQIHDAVYLMKQNIVRHSGMFIGDINGMLKRISD